MRTLCLALLSALTLAPLAAGADGVEEPQAPHATLAPPPHVSERGPCVGDAPIGRVGTLDGAATLARDGASARGLACDDVVRACDLVETGPGAAVGLLLGDAWVQLGPDTRARVAQQPTPEVALERGSVRVIDERAQATQRVRVSAGTLTASGGRGDLELSAAPDGVRVCALDQSAVVEIGDHAQTLAAGSCLATTPGGAEPAGSASGPALALTDTDACPFEVALLPGLAPPPVGEGPLGEFPKLVPFDAPGRDACDQPGSGCASVPSDIFDDPDPDSGCGIPGSPCGG